VPIDSNTALTSLWRSLPVSVIRSYQRPRQGYTRSRGELCIVSVWYERRSKNGYSPASCIHANHQRLGRSWIPIFATLDYSPYARLPSFSCQPWRTEHRPTYIGTLSASPAPGLAWRGHARYPHELTCGEVPSIIYREDEIGMHGNFLSASYRRVAHFIIRIRSSLFIRRGELRVNRGDRASLLHMLLDYFE
jgi:hypothetical protein